MRQSKMNLLVTGVILCFVKGAAMAAESSDGFKSLDIRSIVNMDWKDEQAGDGKGGWTDQGDNDMRNVSPGMTQLLGVPFDLIDPAKNDGKAVLTLKSLKFLSGAPSAQIDVGMKAASIYFLHASAWTKDHMATYTVYYEDGTSVASPIRAGEEIGDWWSPNHGKQYRAALHLTNAQTDDVGLMVFGWNNPNPEKVIKRLEFKSMEGLGVVVLAAVTLSQKPVALPDPQDIPLPEYLQSDASTLDASQWFNIEPKKDVFAPTCIDQLPHLDTPAGKHGFQKPVNGQWVFEDGTPCRMVATMGNLPDTKEECDYMARLLAKFGFTMLRMGFFHCYPAKDSLVDWTKPDSQHVNDQYFDRLDYFIAELAKRGIYTRLNIFWFRKVKKGDNVEGFDEAIAYAHKHNQAVPKADKEDVLNTMCITFFHPRVIELNIEFHKAVMAHRNPYRDNKAYGEDPAICQTEVTNEDGTLASTIDFIAPVFKKMLDRQWIAWLQKKYGTDEKLFQAWGDDLGGTDSLEEGRIGRISLTSLSATVPPGRPKRLRDQLEFYAELQNQYFTKTREALRQSGMKQPICGSAWYGAGGAYFADIWANAKGMDYVDRHHYYGGQTGWQILEMKFNDICALRNPEMLLKLGSERVMGMPFTVSEWAACLPNQTHLEAPGLMAFYGNSLGGWDTPIHFAWGAKNTFTDFLQQMWPVNDASTLCQYPALSQMIRRADIKQGQDAFIRNLSDETVLSGKPLKDVLIRLDISGPFEALSTHNNVNARGMAAVYAGAVGRTGIGFTVKEEKPDFSIDLNRYMDLEKKEIHSATGELYWNYNIGYVTADAPRMQAAIGFLNNLPINLKDCNIQTTNPIASVLVAPLDEKPLAESKHILITAVGRFRNTDMAYSRGGQRMIKRGVSPTRLEGVKGSVELKRSGHCTVTALDPFGYKAVDVTPSYQENSVTIPMDGSNKAAYYEVNFN